MSAPYPLPPPPHASGGPSFHRPVRGTIEYRRGVDYASAREGNLLLCIAPDGIPLVIAPPDIPDAASLLRGAARALGFGNAPAPELYEGTVLHATEEALRAALALRHVFELALAGGERALVTLVSRPLRELVGGTLLERLLSATFESPIASFTAGSQPAGVWAASPAERWERTVFPPLGNASHRTATGFGPRAGPEERPFRPGEALVAIRGDGLPLVVNQARGPGGWPTVEGRHALVDESILGLAAAKLSESPATPDEHFGPLSDADLERYRARRSDASSDWYLHVPGHALATVLVGAVEDLAKQHSDGHVHGDVKPANLLVTSGGPKVIDSLGIEPGKRSPAVTRGWTSPEQVLANPVSAQTDQYAIGLLALALVGGVLYGEEATVAVPTGGRDLQRHTIFRDPGVFIDPESSPVPADAIERWRLLIERCVRFRAEDRFPRDEDLAAEVAALANAVTIGGSSSMELRFGALCEARPIDTTTQHVSWYIP